MWRFGYDTNATFILTIALLSMLGTVLMWQKQRTGKTIHVWFWSAFFGILLGCAGTYALVRITKGNFLMPPMDVMASADEEGSSTDEPGGMGSPEGGSGMEMGGSSGGGAGGRGMFGGPRPKRDLTSLVRKVALLSGEIGIDLPDDQGVAFMAALKDIEKPETMTDDEAQAKYDELLALLNDDQKAQLDAVGLPRGQRPSGAERPAEDANPFLQEPNSAALEVLHGRFSPKGDEGAS